LHRRLLLCCALGAACVFSTLVSNCQGASAAVVAAASPTPSPSPSAPAEIGHVTTSDRRFEPVDLTSRPTYVIDRAQLDAMGAQTVADALATLPGVSIYRYGAYGAQTDYGVLGATPEQTLVLLDGVPVAVGTTGSIDLGSFPLGSVSRIEVVESGASTLYGTSAVGGVINIITAPARRTDVAPLARRRTHRLQLRAPRRDQRLSLSRVELSRDGLSRGRALQRLGRSERCALELQSSPGRRFLAARERGPRRDRPRRARPARFPFAQRRAANAARRREF
jgi:hypothetical protein